MARIKPSIRPRTKRDDVRYAKLLSIVQALPEIVIEGGRHKKIAVGKKTVAYYCDDHHGDGMISLWVKSTPETRDAFIASDAKTFFFPPYVGPAGWIAIRMDLARLDWDIIKELLIEAYRLQAPRRLQNF